MLKLILTTISVLAVMSLIYWLIQKVAEWIDEKRIERMKQKDFLGIGTRKDGSRVFDEYGNPTKRN